jgi:predicted membrane channel-forming protein YqfA (hemolysin III family)
MGPAVVGPAAVGLTVVGGLGLVAEMVPSTECSRLAPVAVMIFLALAVCLVAEMFPALDDGARLGSWALYFFL